MRLNRILTGVLVTVLTATSSCEKDFLDVNVDPNNPTTASVELVLPTALGYSAYNIGNPYQIVGGLWGQYWTQGPTASQYKAYEQYAITSSTFDNQWESVYSGPLTDFKYLVDEGLATNKPNYAAIGKIMQAYMFQVMTDLHGDIPFSESLQATSNNITPKFDTQEEVYNGLLTLINDGVALIDDNTVHPGNEDYFYHGDMDQWRRFANTLKLKILLRQAYVRPAVAEQEIKAMYDAGVDFIDQGDEAHVPFSGEQFNQHPLFATYQALTTANLLASQTALGYMLSNDDPRVDVFYARATASPNAGNHAGIVQGNGPNLPGQQDANSYSKPGPEVGGPITADDENGGADAPVIFISEAESYFLQAEAVARGWGAGDAEQLYNDAIRLSFLRWGFSLAEADAYLAQPAVKFPSAGSTEQKIEAIITQKWVSMNGTQNVEAWTEWRRTGYPDFFLVSATSSMGNVFPVRLLYPDSEVSRNPKTPPQKTVTDKLWWDVNTTGQN